MFVLNLSDNKDNTNYNFFFLIWFTVVCIYEGMIMLIELLIPRPYLISPGGICFGGYFHPTLNTNNEIETCLGK